jgi:Transcriptional regulator, AbiEi antitoxin
MGHQGRTVEEKLAWIASRSHGVVTRAELLAAGISPKEIRHRVAIGALLRVHRGVYRVGHRAPSVEASYLAAVRAGGAGAVLWSRPAGWLLAVVKGRAPRAEVLARTERRIEGVRTRRSRHLDPRDRTLWKGIPVTTVPRTLVDLAEVLSFDALSRACHEAGVLHRTTPAQVKEVLARRPNAPGARKLREVLEGKHHVTLSRLEKRFLDRLREVGLPLPITNRPAGTKRVDCRWPDHHLTVELDSYTFHNSHYAWEQDRRRERQAHARGDQHRRYTYGDVFDDPAPMLAELGGVLLS